MIEKEGLSSVLPNVTNLEEGEQVYYQFYSKLDEIKFGVIALVFKIVNYV